MDRLEREEFDQNDFFAQQLLKLPVHKIYTEQDLNDERVLNRAIDLLHHKRQGQDTVTRSGGVHINYWAIPEEIRDAAVTPAIFSMNKWGRNSMEYKKRAMTRLQLHWSQKK